MIKKWDPTAIRVLDTRKRDKFWNQCGRKEQKTKKNALDDAILLTKKEGLTVTAYECPWCGTWHNGHLLLGSEVEKIKKQRASQEHT